MDKEVYDKAMDMDRTILSKFLTALYKAIFIWVLLGLNVTESMIPNYTTQNNTKESHNSCSFNNKTYAPGYFYISECVKCYCDPFSNNVRCSAVECLPIPSCTRYQSLEGKCCPVCIEYGCSYNGSFYSKGSKINTDDACRNCYCPWDIEISGGNVVCFEIECKRPRCVDSIVPQGRCCPICPNGPNCFLDDRIIAEGERIYIDNCRDCSCSKDDYIARDTPRHATCTRSFFCL